MVGGGGGGKRYIKTGRWGETNAIDCSLFNLAIVIRVGALLHNITHQAYTKSTSVDVQRNKVLGHPKHKTDVISSTRNTVQV